MINFEEMISKSVDRMADKNKVDKVELLPHNQMLYEQIEDKIKEGYKSIFYSEGTGLGKSFIFMRLVQDYFEGMNILYIVPKISIWKNLTRYEEFKTLNANIEMRTFASFNTYDKSDCEFYDVVFVDECHHMLSDIQGNNVRILCRDMNSLNKYSFGFTATPYYQDSYVDEVCFDCSCFGLDVFEAVEAKIFKKIKLAVAGIDLDSIPEEYKVRYSIVGTEPLLNRILKEHSDIQRWLAYFSSKAELECAYSDLRELFPDYKILKLYTGIDNEDDILDQFEEYDGRVILMSVSKLLEGVHLRDVGGVLLYRNTGELSTYMQMYGRLCNMNNENTPLFLDVTNSIVTLTNISSFKSNRYLGQRREFSPKDFLDIDSVDYWTFELSQALGKSYAWTKEEDDIIIQYYPSEGRDVYKRLNNRTMKATAARAFVLGVKYIGIHTKEFAEQLYKDYCTMTMEELCTKYNISKATIAKLLKEFGYVLSKSVQWSDDEDDIVKKHYSSGAKYINTLLPNRSISAIRNRAETLGLNKRDTVSEEDVAKIVSLWENRKLGEISAKFSEELPHLTMSRIYGVLKKLGYDLKDPKCYKDDELLQIDMLIQEGKSMEEIVETLNLREDNINYGVTRSIKGLRSILTTRDIFKVRDCDIAVLKSKYSTLGEECFNILSRKYLPYQLKVCLRDIFNITSSVRWTSEEDEILINNYPIIGKDVHKLLNGRSQESCATRAAYLGCSKRQAIWTEDKDTFLLENQDMTLDDLANNLNMSVSQITTRLKKLGIGKRKECIPYSNEEDKIILDMINCKAADVFKAINDFHVRNNDGIVRSYTSVYGRLKLLKQ